MLLTKIIPTKIYNSNLKYYKDKYNCKLGDIINICIKDIPIKSHVLIDWKCDYCGNEMKPKRYGDYIRHRDSRITHDDCCEKCKSKKIQKSNLLKYNVKNVMQNKEIYNKQILSCKNNIGVEHPYQDINILHKALTKAKKTMYNNNTAPCSRQQKYLHNILGGKLNYPINTLNLDIAFPKEKIYIEYDGGGHDLQVKFHNITSEEQKSTQRKREYLLQSKGWKLIRIISSKDYLPLEIDIIKLINKAIQYILKGHSWCEINIDDYNINGTDIYEHYELNNLQLIHKNNLAISIK